MCAGEQLSFDDLRNRLSGPLGGEHTPFCYYTEGQHDLLWF